MNNPSRTGRAETGRYVWSYHGATVKLDLFAVTTGSAHDGFTFTLKCSQGIGVAGEPLTDTMTFSIIGAVELEEFFEAITNFSKYYNTTKEN